jgi:hypothetical protein
LIMVKPMKRRDVIRALRRNGCVIKNDKGRHIPGSASAEASTPQTSAAI